MLVAVLSMKTLSSRVPPNLQLELQLLQLQIISQLLLCNPESAVNFYTENIENTLQMSEIAKNGWKNYMWQLQHRPLPTKAITAGVLSGISDAAAQKLSGGQKLQFKRLLLRMLFGFVYFGPIGHYKHILLDKIFRGRTDKRTVTKKMIVDQLTASPWNNLVFMMYYGYIVEGRTWREVQTRTKKGFPSLQLTSWMFWPVVSWINFQYMPIQFRVVFQSFVACCWGIFLNLRARTLVLNK